jgi:hypothetical protein
LPHSEILGSKPVCGSPKLFAAYHVLHRLLAPRHSPYALSSLTIVLELGTNAYRASRLAVRDSIETEPRTANYEIAACDSPLTHCMCCGRKNYRLQDIQLSKIDPGEQSLGCRAPSGLLPRTPSLASPAGPIRPAPFRSRELFILPAVARTCKRYRTSF